MAEIVLDFRHRTRENSAGWKRVSGYLITRWEVANNAAGQNVEWVSEKQAREKEFSMLVLSRQRDESIIIGDDIEITIVDIRGGKVRIGINAPKNITIHRKEIYEAIRKEKEQAAETSHTTKE